MLHALRRLPGRRRLLGALVLSSVLLASGCMLQDHLLYYPEQTTVAEVMARYPRLRPWPSPSEPRGFLFEAPAAPRGTAIVFHGNAGHAAQRQWYAEALTRRGWRTVLAEYPGYGPRSGKPREEALIQDAIASLRLAQEQFGSPLLVIGESLGAAVAAGAAGASTVSIAGLVLITPWDNLSNVAKHHYPWLPVALLLRDAYDSAARLKSFTGPSAVVVAEADSIIPAALGRQLFTALPGKKHLISIPSAEHNDWAGRIDTEWWPRLLGELIPPD